MPRRATSSQPAITCKPAPCPGLPGPGKPPPEHSTSAWRPGNKRWLENLKTKMQDTISSQEIFLTFRFSKKGGFITRAVHGTGAGRQQTFRVSHTPPSGQPSSRHMALSPSSPAGSLYTSSSLSKKALSNPSCKPLPPAPTSRCVLCSGGIQSPRGQSFLIRPVRISLLKAKASLLIQSFQCRRTGSILVGELRPPCDPVLARSHG